MIDLYTAGTPNGKKVSVMLEEVGLPYKVHKVDIGKGEQFRPEFLAISPNNKIPAIVDNEGPGAEPLSVFESGAILWYLAAKTEKLLPADTRGRTNVHQWLMFQMGGVGPMLGQNYHFAKAAPEKIPYAIERYEDETARLVNVMEKQLGKASFIAGDYSIADIALYPWVAGDWMKLDYAALPNFTRWRQAIAARPAVQRGMAVPG